MEECWRWFGPEDPVPLAHIRQAGATGVVTALHHVAIGAAWPVAEIRRRKQEVAAAGLAWRVVESIPVSEDLKTRSGAWRAHLAAWQETLVRLGEEGIGTVCYNFMPVLDWTRTDLGYPLPSGARALRFDATDFAAFDIHLLARPGAAAEWGEPRAEAARARVTAMDEAARERLERNIIAGLPGSDAHYTLAMLRAALARYDGMGAAGLAQSLAEFLAAVVPAAAEAGVRLAIHPDDPPRPLLGLPRVVSTAADARRLLAAVPGPANGLTLCAGSYGVRADNDLPAMAREFAGRIHFVHLRATRREADPESFHEAAHLDGDVDMVALIAALLAAERGRGESLPMRPDHGHQMLDDLAKRTNPGYSAIGRLKGLAELRGVMRAVDRLGVAGA